jgi:hypothetical protein
VISSARCWQLVEVTPVDGAVNQVEIPAAEQTMVW